MQYFTTDFAGNIEAEKITSFTIAETGVVITQNPPVVNINPPTNPPNTPPFETADDFPPNRGDNFTTIITIAPENAVSQPSESSPNKPNFGGDDSTPSPTPRISRIIRPILDESGLPVVAQNHAISTIISSEPMKYVDHPLPFQPISTTTIIKSDEPVSTPTSSPLDVTMLAMLGVGVAGMGMMKSQTAIAKKQDQHAQQTQALDELKTLQSAQKAEANANWMQNQTMQTQAKQVVFTPVTESQAYIEFKSNWVSWARKAEIARMLRDIDGTIFEVANESQDVRLAVSRIKQGWDRAITEGLMSRDTLLSYEQDLAQCFLDGVVNISNLQSLMTTIYEYNINVSQNMSDDESKIALSRLFASSLHITAYFDEISEDMEQTKSGLATFNEFFTKTIVGEEIYPVTLYLGADLT